MEKLPNILIVGTIPYNLSSQSRAMGSYFGNWENRENAIQIYSDPSIPSHGHCKSFYQLTDKMMLKSRIKNKKCEGIIYNDIDLDKNNNSNHNHVQNRGSFARFLIKRKTPFVRLARKFVWNKRIWKTQKLEKWVEDFKPDIVYIGFSNDFFILEIAYYFATKYNIPIVTIMGDDYYYNKYFTISPFYYIYRSRYNKLFRKIYSYNTYVFYGSKKIKDKYSEFKNTKAGLLYISSELDKISSWENKPTNHLLYAGNLTLGRHKSIIKLASVLNNVDKDFYVDVYGPTLDSKILNEISNAKGVKYHGGVPYKELMEHICSSSGLLFVEDFSKKNIEFTRYSLSTKVADYLSTSIPTFAFGPIDAGAIGYLKENDVAVCCIDENEIIEKYNLFINKNYREELSKKAYKLSRLNHTKEVNSKKFYDIVCELVKENKKECLHE